MKHTAHTPTARFSFQRFHNLTPSFVSGFFLFIAMLAITATASAQSVGLVSVRTDGTAGGNGESFDSQPSVSADGKFVAFQSLATNLTANPDANNARDVYVRNRETNTTVLASVTPSGAAGNGDSFGATLSPDGRHVVFYSNASNLTSITDSNNAYDVFVRDLETGTTRMASVKPSGTASNTGVFTHSGILASISDSGQYVIFMASAHSILGGAPPTTFDATVFIHQFDTPFSAHTTYCISTDSANNPRTAYLPNPTRSPAISGDGRFALYQASDLYSYDTTARSARMIYSSSNHGVAAFVDGATPDGRFIVFTTDASTLTSNPDSNGRYDVFVYDRNTNTTVLVSQTPSGATGNSESREGAISADGRYVAFTSLATNIIPNITGNLDYQIYRRDLQTNTTQLVSKRSPHEPNYPNNASADRTFDPRMSANGQIVAFQGYSRGGLVLGDDCPSGYLQEGCMNIYARDMTAGVTRRVSSSAINGARGNSASVRHAISGDGTTIAFASAATNLVANDTNNFTDVFVSPGGAFSPGTLNVTDAQDTSEHYTNANLTFYVQRTNGASGRATVQYATSDSTATADDDYVAQSGTLTFEPGETEKIVTVIVNNDSHDDGDFETVLLTISTPTGATLGVKTVGTGRIEDDDPPDPPAFSVMDATGRETPGGSTVDCTVTLSFASSEITSVTFSTNNQSASSTSDYVSRTVRITFNPGETSKQISLQIIDDEIQEPTETFLIFIVDPSSNATIARSNGTATILDDDRRITLPAIADAYVKGATVDANYGSVSELQIKRTLNPGTGKGRQAYLRFDTSGVTTAVTLAKLRVYGRLSQLTAENRDIPCAVFPVSALWSEGALSWANKPAPNVPNELARVIVTDDTPRWYEFDITNFVNQERAAKRVVTGVLLRNMIKSGSGDFYTVFNSREARAFKPELYIEFAAN